MEQADIKVGANRTTERVVLDLTAPSGHRVIVQLGKGELEGLIQGLSEAQRILDKHRDTGVVDSIATL